MKIAIFSDNFYPELSGISDSIVLLAKELAKLNHQVNFYVPRYSAKNYRVVNLPVKELALGDKIKINRLAAWPALFAGLQARAVLPLLSGRLFRDGRPDIIHSQLFFGAGLEAMLSAHFSKIPFIGTNHTAISEFIKFVPFNSHILKTLSLRYAVWYYNHCHFVTAPSQSVFKEMNQYGFNRPHQVISNPIDMTVFSASENKAELKKRFKLSEQTIVYAGRLASEKNIDIVIRAVASARRKIKNINLAIAGSGKFEPELKQLIQELNLQPAVKFFGTLPQKDLAKLYGAADVFAIASTSDTQSLTLMQAMACALPAVVVDARALPEYVNDKNGYVVKAGDYQAMAEKFVLLLGNPELNRKLSQGAYDFVQRFSAANIAKEWEKLYNKVIGDCKNNL
ncbi:MAG: glycosyltransferase [Patescibacteria group bacterium]|nr:glycosyltransferase [Patescibacteria group bacterium]